MPDAYTPPGWDEWCVENAGRTITLEDAFGVWLDMYIVDGGGPHWHQDDVFSAFVGGVKHAFASAIIAVTELSALKESNGGGGE